MTTINDRIITCAAEYMRVATSNYNAALTQLCAVTQRETAAYSVHYDGDYNAAPNREYNALHQIPSYVEIAESYQQTLRRAIAARWRGESYLHTSVGYNYVELAQYDDDKRAPFVVTVEYNDGHFADEEPHFSFETTDYYAARDEYVAQLLRLDATHAEAEQRYQALVAAGEIIPR